jgi:hypothetical protein
LFDAQVNSVSKFKVDYSGLVTTAAGMSIGGAAAPTTNGLRVTGSINSADYIQAGTDIGSASATGFVYFGTSGGFLGTGSSAVVKLTNNSQNAGVRLDASINGTLNILAFGGGDTGILRVNALTVTSLTAATGVNYVCTSTTGVFSKNNTACVGTDAEAIALVPVLQQQIADLRAELSALISKWGIR